MTDTTNKVLEHYSAVGLTGRIQSALAAIAPESQTLTVAQLAPLDQFHLRGILATSELASATGIEPSTRVLDLGCGIGGPARYLAASEERARRLRATTGGALGFFGGRPRRLTGETDDAMTARAWRAACSLTISASISLISE